MRRSLIFIAAAILLAQSLITSAQPQPDGPRLPDGSRLKELADEAGLLLGVRTFFRNDAQKTIIAREFNVGTMTCYPQEINRRPGQNDLENFNTGVNWFHERGMKPMHHMLFGPSQYESEWVGEITSPDELETLMNDRIRIIMESNDNASKVNVWNIVNESLQYGREGTYFREDKTVWARMGFEEDKSGLTGDDKVNDIHPVYIRKAFEYADRYAKGKLELRETGCESPGRKAKALFQLVRHLQNSGVRIDGIGLQCHFTIKGKGSLDPQGLALEIRKYRSIGLEVYLDEVDFYRDELPWTPELAERQKEEYKKLITVALEEGVSQVHIWGLRDADENWHGDVNPLLFDENLEVKPAYYGVQEALSEFIGKRK
ncbi:endo-1,4-beta-xylanase [Candidatus Latescibacterota bacterium]